ncbi:MAG: transcriptional regulator, MarR family protein [Acidobacteria bacterium]|nr:transcriptional regulator, MarR family protein [Acidobacteriota bacterium]
MAGRAETLEAINDLLASATIFTSTSADLLATGLLGIAGDRLTFAQLKLLRLVQRQGTLSIGDVAGFLGVSNAAASKAVDRLVRSGVLSRAEGRGDRRTTEVTVTAEGHALLEQFEARTSGLLLKRLAGADPRRLRDLSGSLDRLSMFLSAGDEEARVCFRCGLYFREECLLRTLTDRQCYLHLGSGRRSGESLPAARRVKGGYRGRATTGGIR